MTYVPYLLFIAGSICFILGPAPAKIGPWLFIFGSIIAMGQL